MFVRLSGMLFLCVVFFAPAAVDAQGLFRRFMPVDRVESSEQGSYELNQNNGPWLIMAATFSGEGGQQQAQQLAVELRQRLNVKAYVHDLKLDLPTENIGRGVDQYGNRRQMRYQSGSTVREWAVLAGEFPTIDDPDARRLLHLVKTFQPEALKASEDGQTYQTLARIREHQKKIIQRVSHSAPMGPMRTAFVTRNPLLPKEYFVPKGVDKFVAKMNKGVRYSLLDMKKRYSVKVATFHGKERLQTVSTASKFRKNKREESDPLVKAAENAHLLCEEMRRLNIEAYEFHDRSESYVAVGSFDKVAKIGEAGQLYPTQEMMPILRAFGAAYNTPSDPLQRADEQLPGAVHKQAAEVEQQFKYVFSQKHGQVAGGLNPKFARVPPKSKNARVIPFDIHPTVVEAPKRSVSTSFGLFR